MAAAAYKLTYFAGKGLAEPTRIMFALAGQAYEDERFPYDVSATDAEKKHPEFTTVQKAGAFVASMHSLPVLTYNGMQIGQSKAVERFVAAKCGFAGIDEVERAQIDCICEHLREINDAYLAQVHLSGKTGDELARARDAFALDWYLNALEACVGDGGFAVGGRRSRADVICYYYFGEYFARRYQLGARLAALLPACPKLQAIVASVAAQAQAYLEARAPTPF